MTSKIPATVITGFLGAGKTSLIRHLLQHSRGRRLAPLINEFGSLGIDRAIIGGCGIPTCREEDVIELASGCIGQRGLNLAAIHEVILGEAAA